MMKKTVLGAGLLSLATLALVGCGGSRDNASNSANAKTDLKVAMITDTGGVDDKSFNQSAWEGLEKWGKDNGLSKGNGYDYFQSASESDFATNIDSAMAAKYKLVFGVGFALHTAIEEAADQNPDTDFVLIDDVIEGKDNVASVLFADNESAYLAGVAAAKTTKTNKVGFIGGVEGAVLTRFEVGFIAGVKSVNKNIEVKVDYAASFSDAAKGKTLAKAQYSFGADVIYQAAAASGAGVISEAKSLNETRPEADKVWVIGCDRDQSAEGEYTSKDGKKSNFMLTSTVKGVGEALIAIANDTEKGNFPGGETITFGLKDGAIYITTDNLSADAKSAVEAAEKEIKDGSVEVPATK